MMLKMHAVAVFGSLLVSFMVSADLADFLESLSTAVTGDNYVFVGDDLQLTCTLNEDYLQNYTADNISFKFQSHARGDFICVPASNVKVDSTDVARLLIHNVSMNNAGPYGCYVGTSCPNEPENFVGASDDVIVDYPPHNVTNFSCVIYNWDELMVCNWKHPVDYINTSYIEVTTLYTVLINPQLRPEYYKCPLQDYSRCSWNKTNFTASYNYNVFVTVKNMKTNNATTGMFYVVPSNLVKPDPVLNLAISVLEERPDCLVLSWNNSRPLRDKLYRVKHSSRKDQMFTVLVDNLTDMNYTACGYPAYTYHNYSVESYPTASYRGFWSDPEYVCGRTPMTAPSDGPRIINGSFTTTSCVKGVRNVTVMWQKVDESSQNGVIDHFLIKVGGRLVVTVGADVYSATINNLPCNSTSELTIFAQNKGGNSLKPSVLFIPSVDVSVPRTVQDSFSVEIVSNQSLNLSVKFLRALWEVDKETTNMNYTIFWCRGLPGQLCEGELYWNQVAGTQTNYNLPIAISDAGKYLYGISVTDTVTELASGLVWTGCLFNQKETIEQKTVKRLDLSSGENAVTVSWLQIPCTYESMVKVTNYMIKWCQTNRCDNTEEVFNYSVPAMEFMYTVSGLTANVPYRFTVQPMSYGDVGVEVKPWKDAVPVSAEKPSIKLIYVIVGVFGPLILLVPLVALFYWKCMNGKIKSEKLSSSKFLPQQNTAIRSAANHTPQVEFSAGNGSVRLLQPANGNDFNCSSSDSECDLVTISPERTTSSDLCDHVTISPERTTSSDLCDSHQFDGRTIPESTSSNVGSIHSYQQFAIASLNQSLEHSNSKLEKCVVHVDSLSTESNHHLADSQSSNMQIGLTEENDKNRQPSMSVLDHSRIRETPVSDTLIDIVAVGVTSPVLQHVSVTFNEAKPADVTLDDLLFDFTNDSCSEPTEGIYERRSIQKGAETSTSHDDETCNFFSSNGIDGSSESYSQLSLFQGQQRAESDNC